VNRVSVGEPGDNCPDGSLDAPKKIKLDLKKTAGGGGVNWSVLTHNRNQLAGLCEYSGEFLGTLRD
jgi:hypothetical protein